jgi:UDP-galactopyranose mutase
MDQVVGQALATYRRINEALPLRSEAASARVMTPSRALAS